MASLAIAYRSARHACGDIPLVLTGCSPADSASSIIASTTVMSTRPVMTGMSCASHAAASAPAPVR